MVMTLSESLDTQRADSIACRTFNSELHTPKKMSHGPTLFSCGIMDPDRWRDRDRTGPLRVDQPGAGAWERPPERAEPPGAGAVTSLIQGLSLSDRGRGPPSKRQCRSLSFSDGLAGGRPCWRPLGSRVWTPVEKRRCHSGGAVPRSSSFSLPSRAPPAAARSPDAAAPAAARLHLPRSLSCSHERVSSAASGAPSASSTPASTPELARRPGGLARSRSQPCVLNDKKVGVKRRRPEDAQEPRPSLDLAKMAQNCQTFSSLSCLSAGMEDCGPHSPFGLHVGSTRSWTALLSASGPGGRTPAGTPVPEPPPPSFEEHLAYKEELCGEESDGCALDEGCGRNGEPALAWRDRGASGGSPCSLDGELDIEQIENN